MRSRRTIRTIVIAAVAAAAVVVGVGLFVFGSAGSAEGGASAISGGSGLVGSVGFEEADRLVVVGRLPESEPAVEPASDGALSAGLSAVAAARPAFPAAEPARGELSVEPPAVGAIGSVGEADAERTPASPAARSTEVRRSRVREAAREAPASSGRLDSLAVRRVVGGQRRSLEACYWTARSEYPALAGDATFVVTVKPEGSVEVDVDRTSAELDQSGVTSCIKSRLESLDFQRTPPRGGDVRLRVPMSFEDPRGPEDAAEELR